MGRRRDGREDTGERSRGQPRSDSTQGWTNPGLDPRSSRDPGPETGEVLSQSLPRSDNKPDPWGEVTRWDVVSRT